MPTKCNALPAFTYCFDHAQDHIPDDGYMTEYDGTAACEHKGCTAKATHQIVGDDPKTSPAHTAGPWKTAEMKFDVESNPFVAFRIETDAPTHPSIGDVFFRDEEEESKANARLIAAAPELLEDLKSIVEMAHSVTANWENGDLAEAVRNLDRIASAAEVAIAKAA